MPLLELKNLKMYYKLPNGWVRAVDDISFDVSRRETIGIVGESGSGKTSIGLTILRLLPPNGRILSGEILFKGADLTKIPLDELRKIRWNEISIIFQSAMNALDPVYRVGDLVIEALRIHKNVSKDEASKEVIRVFKLVGLSPSRMKNYPHEFSGGMKQRVMIAMSLICNPDLVISDEPTTALDVLVQDQIFHEMKELQRDLNIAIILISHDISVIMENCDKIAVMYMGKIVEQSDAPSLFKEQYHPYTIGLIRSVPNIQGPMKKITSIPKASHDLLNFSICRFEPRCPIAEEICRNEEPPLIKVADGHYSLCHMALDPQLRKKDIYREG